ncbi:MAG: hypothetical protein WA040_17410 [Anaerolineae bacterium]
MNETKSTHGSQSPAHDSNDRGRAFQIGYMQGWQKGTRAALQRGIAVNLQIKYGELGQDIFLEIFEIDDIGTLMEILEMIRVADSPEDFLYLRQSLIK